MGDFLYHLHGAVIALAKNDVAGALGPAELRASAFIQTGIQKGKLLFRNEELRTAGGRGSATVRQSQPAWLVKEKIRVKSI